MTGATTPVESTTADTAANDAAERAALPAQPSKLLIADDEHLVATGLATSLKDMGYKVIGPASDGAEAVELAELTRPDMALLDIRMPKMSGLEAAEIIYRRMGIPVVIFSAFSDPEYVETGNRIGVFGYILKPVTEDQLRVGVTVAWGRFIDDVGQRQEVANLKQRLEDRKIVEQAKWIIVKRKQLTEPEAMKLLQRQARNNRRQLADVARSILENESLFGEE